MITHNAYEAVNFLFLLFLMLRLFAGEFKLLDKSLKVYKLKLHIQNPSLSIQVVDSSPSGY